MQLPICFQPAIIYVSMHLCDFYFIKDFFSQMQVEFFFNFTSNDSESNC